MGMTNTLTSMTNEMPDIIEVDVPIRVNVDEYLFIISNVRGGVFYRKDENNVCWVMPAYDFACDFIRQALAIFRSGEQKQHTI
jgi:hypothetical protein